MYAALAAYDAITKAIPADERDTSRATRDLHKDVNEIRLKLANEAIDALAGSSHDNDGGS